MALSPVALEVLGTVAACSWSGPHRAPALRKWTRLTANAFEAGLAELAAQGLVHRPSAELFWLTDQAEQAVQDLVP